MRIIIVGKGKVGRALSYSFRQAGYEVELTGGRRFVAGSGRCNADLCFLALPDNVLKTVDLKGKIAGHTAVIHCAGTLPSDIFSGVAGKHGVFYPLRSFTGKEGENLKDANVFVTANDGDTLILLKDLADKSGANVFELPDEQRLKLHMAAVFAHNFTNHMIYIAKKITAESSVPFSVILDLLKPYFESLVSGGNPEMLQTGPAARNDTETIDKHIKLLEEHKDWQNIYSFVTQSIRNTVKKNENNEEF